MIEMTFVSLVSFRTQLCSFMAGSNCSISWTSQRKHTVFLWLLFRLRLLIAQDTSLHLILCHLTLIKGSHCVKSAKNLNGFCIKCHGLLQNISQGPLHLQWNTVHFSRVHNLLCTLYQTFRMRKFSIRKLKTYCGLKRQRTHANRQTC